MAKFSATFEAETYVEFRKALMDAAGDMLQFGIISQGSTLAMQSTRPPVPQQAVMKNEPVPSIGHDLAPTEAMAMSATGHAEQVAVQPEKRQPGRPIEKDPNVVVEKREPGRPKKIADTAADLQTAARLASRAPSKDSKTEVSAEPKAEPKTASKEDLIKALNLVFDKHNIDAARECLAKHGVSKIQELKVNQYAAFMETCEEVLARDIVAEENA